MLLLHSPWAAPTCLSDHSLPPVRHACNLTTPNPSPAPPSSQAWGAAARTLQQAEDDYRRLVKMSMTFYEGQMSGKLPDWNRMSRKNGGWRSSAHLNDGQTIGKDLSGGFYDAGGECACCSVGVLRGNLAGARYFKRVAVMGGL